MKCVTGRTFSEVYIRTKHNLEVYANYAQGELTPRRTVFIMHTTT